MVPSYRRGTSLPTGANDKKANQTRNTRLARAEKYAISQIHHHTITEDKQGRKTWGATDANTLLTQHCFTTAYSETLIYSLGGFPKPPSGGKRG